MRTSFLAAAVLVALAGGTASAQQPIYEGPVGPGPSNYYDEGLTDYTLDSGCCDSGCAKRCRLHLKKGCGHWRGGGALNHWRGYEGQHHGFNCGCQGSYKFPVPPQYTYFWPGSTYSLELMTNFHSPYRFPPLKPYTDEHLTPASADAAAETLQPVGYNDAATRLAPGEVEAMSSMMERFFR